MENRDFKKRQINNPRKPMRSSRRSHTRRSRRRIPQDCAITNIAEARREILNALHLHRMSSSSSTSKTTSSSTTTTTTTASYGNNFNYGVSVNNTTTSTVFARSSECDHHNVDQYYCYPCMMENLPVPQPTWSTTAPSTLALAPPPPPPPFDQALYDEFELGDQNQASSYTWWLTFLKTLDSNYNNNKITHDHEEESSCYNNKKPFEGNFVMGNSWAYDGHECNYNNNMDGLSSMIGSHEWLTIPTNENDQGEIW